jgi:hypothetical protein
MFSTVDTAQKHNRNRSAGLGKGRESTMTGSHSTTGEENIKNLSIMEQTRGSGVEESNRTSRANPNQPAPVSGLADAPRVSNREDTPPGETLEDVARRIPLVIPEGHKLVHIMRHARAWHK